MAEAWTAERVRAQLLRPPPAEDPEDRHVVRTHDPGVRIGYAAVLVPLVSRSHGVQILLTQRTAHLNDHAGQISFPGGRVEESDASREMTALRETEEEVGVQPASISVLGSLPEHHMPSGFRITPVIGWIVPPFDVKPDPFEVADVFEAPLTHFLNPANYQRREYRFRGKHRHYLAVPWEGRYIWGATAGMLHTLCRVLNHSN